MSNLALPLKDRSLEKKSLMIWLHLFRNVPLRCLMLMRFQRNIQQVTKNRWIQYWYKSLLDTTKCYSSWRSPWSTWKRVSKALSCSLKSWKNSAIRFMTTRLISTLIIFFSKWNICYRFQKIGQKKGSFRWNRCPLGPKRCRNVLSFSKIGSIMERLRSSGYQVIIFTINRGSISF